MIRRQFLCRTLAALAMVAASFLGLGRTARAEDDKPIRALFICGGCCHDYAKQKDIITQGISGRANVVWTIAFDPDRGSTHLNPIYENPDWARDFDVVVHDECTAAFSQYNEKKAKDPKDADAVAKENADAKEKAKKEQDVVENIILKAHKAGLPAVILHCGMHCYRSEGWPKTVTPWFEFTGLQTTGHGAQLPIELTYTDKENAITKGLGDWTTIKEELYNNIAGKVLDTAHPLAHGKQISKGKDGKESVTETVVVWTNIYNGKTKVFATTIGHNNETCGDPRYLDLVTRGLLWSVDKLDDSHLKAAK
jgi:type 1 glutamine amidotransferase